MEAKRSSAESKRDSKETKSLTRPLISSSHRVLPDDIECDEWLQEVGMEQYRETFLSNFTHGGRYLSRKRLSQVRLQDFPKMNITNFQDQKVLYEHIKITLQHEYANPERRRMSQILSPAKVMATAASDAKETHSSSLSSQAKDFKKNFERLESEGGVTSGSGDGSTEERRNSKNLKKQDSQNTTETIEQRKKAQRAVVRKRNSFDGKVWETIHKYRGTPNESLPPQPAPVIAEAKKKGPRRRSTFDGLPTANDDATKGKMYGNMVSQLLSPSLSLSLCLSLSLSVSLSLSLSVSLSLSLSLSLSPSLSASSLSVQALQFNLLQSKMLTIQEKHLQNIRDTIGCDIVNILFFNDHSRELMMCINERWFRVPSDSGVSGWCVTTGETVNIPDAYMDHRFNESVSLSLFAPPHSPHSLIEMLTKRQATRPRQCSAVLFEPIAAEGGSLESLNSSTSPLVNSSTLMMKMSWLSSSISSLTISQLSSLSFSPSTRASPPLPHQFSHQME
jgi:hypothetical protein